MNQRPDSPAQIQEAVQQALETHRPLHIFAGQSKWALGARVENAQRLDLSGLDRIVAYEPDELILVAEPGVPLQKVEHLLAQHGQHLAFEPPHWGPTATLGGTVACNLSGPRRFKAGALRDYVLGIELVDGRGQRIRAGGKVVKNVTGYDLSKVLSGSFGTLGVLTEVCLKVLPRPPFQCSLLAHGLGADKAIAQLIEWAALPLQITGLAHLPETTDVKAGTVARLEGPEAAVKTQLASLKTALGKESSLLDEADSQAWWTAVREREHWQADATQQLWRFVLPPTRAAELLAALAPHSPQTWGLDWGGGLLWALLPDTAPAPLLHELARQHQGLAWRFASHDQDPNPHAFSPLEPGLARLNQRLRKVFDPQQIFNPGKL